MAAGGVPLAAPWGLALAPAGFGPFSGDLLVGSFMASEINAFDPSGNFVGTIPINIGSNMPGGLWALGFGTGGMNGNPNTLFFTDGINGEMDGLFGALNVPGPIAGAGRSDLGQRRSSRLVATPSENRLSLRHNPLMSFAQSAIAEQSRFMSTRPSKALI
jgi:hypothetical protein